ncbi:hypothetical protein QTG54_007534 [Skeletonema marinoi]|uniref:O-fucosyltransferase family protein n=1 Tax=Skeletonema marinoi TaxID=267567 RepID=A0AAD8YAV7_9STRA|nr:hypothetical protein QTG54_007534 [Skeletonema marinoi]
MMHRRAAQKAAAAVAVIFLVINAFVSFNSYDVDYDPTEISRRLDGTQRTIRARIIDSLRERRGIKPGDPDFQRLFLARLEDLQAQSELPTARRTAQRTLDNTKQIWMRSDKERENELVEAHKSNVMNNEGVWRNVEPLSVCGRPTNVGSRADLALLEHARVDKTCPGANSNKLLLLQGQQTYGQTGNNLIEIQHALQYARDHDVTLGIMDDSWPLRVLLPMFMAIRDKDKSEWQNKFEKEFCVKIFNNESELTEWDIVQWDNLATLGEGRGLKGMDVDYLTSKKMFVYVSQAPLLEYIAHQSKILQKLYRNYNTGTGTTSRTWESVRNMCSGIDAIFGEDSNKVVYSVLHSRSLEGQSGVKLMQRMSQSSGCHPTAALDMEPEYIKAILRPLGMLKFPILVITDGQNFDVIRRLVNDEEIGPQLRLVPGNATWLGGDVTLAVMSNVFIGNPASTLSGFITKSRLALGFGHSYSFRAKNDGEWANTCGDTCVYDRKIMGSMS